MTTTESTSARERQEPSGKQTRRVNVWAIPAVVLGIASAAAMAGPAWWWVAGVGLAVSAAALWQLNTQVVQEQSVKERGRPLALLGLSLSLAFAVGGPTHHIWRQVWISQQSRSVGMKWLNYIMVGEAYKALEMTRPAEQRRLNDARLKMLYSEDELRRRQYAAFLDRKLVRTLRALSHEARRRHYQTEQIERLLNRDRITDVYAVTFFEDGERKTFFVMLLLERREDPTTAAGVWRVVRFEGGYRPQSIPSAS